MSRSVIVPARHFARRHDRRPASGRRAGFRAAIAGARTLRRQPAPAAAPAAARSAARLAADRPPRGQRSRRQARAGRGAAAAGRRRQAADRAAQAAARLQHRGLCQRHRQCALAARRRQGHRVRRHPLGNKVTAIVKKDGKTEVKIVAEGLYRPNGLAYHKGTLYIAELSQISKIENVEDNLDKPQKPTVIYTDLPKDEAHGWKFIAIGPDKKLYVPVGQPGNNVLHDKDHGQIRRINLDGTGRVNVAVGVRNTVGFDWNPVNKQLYFSDNGRDWLSEDVPRGRTQPHHQGQARISARPIATRATSSIRNSAGATSAASYTPPIMLTGPHSAGLGLRFYTGNMFPAKYKNAIFLARHGSWNRTNKFGGDVIVVYPQQGRHGEIVGAVRDRLPDRQQIYRPPGGRAAHDGRLDAAVRRLERRDLSHHLRQAAQDRQPLDRTHAAGGVQRSRPFSLDETRHEAISALMPLSPPRCRLRARSPLARRDVGRARRAVPRLPRREGPVGNAGDARRSAASRRPIC